MIEKRKMLKSVKKRIYYKLISNDLPQTPLGDMAGGIFYLDTLYKYVRVLIMKSSFINIKISI